MVYRTPEEIRRGKIRELKLTLSEAAREMARLRPRSQKSCPTCQKDFLGLANQKYCSTNCRVKAYYKRSRPVT